MISFCNSVGASLHWHTNELKIAKKITMDYILLEVYNATYDDFSILIPENNGFNLRLNPNLGGVGSKFRPPPPTSVGFPYSLNNSKTVKAVTRTFYSTQ